MPDYFFKDLEEAVDFIVEDPYAGTFKQVYAHYDRFSGKGPYIILIGGNTRSGKSTLASYLNMEFRKEGLETVVVGLDNWILPEKDRLPSMDVYDRFQLSKIEKDLMSFFEGSELSLTTYVNHPEREALPVHVSGKDANVIIVEGIVALSSVKIRKRSHLRLFTAIPEQVLEKRFFDYYKWRGKTDVEIKQLLEKRKQDEYGLIEKECKLADLTINPPKI